MTTAPAAGPPPGEPVPGSLVLRSGTASLKSA